MRILCKKIGTLSFMWANGPSFQHRKTCLLGAMGPLVVVAVAAVVAVVAVVVVAAVAAAVAVAVAVAVVAAVVAVVAAVAAVVAAVVAAAVAAALVVFIKTLKVNDASDAFAHPTPLSTPRLFSRN